jgi:putative membrane protein
MGPSGIAALVVRVGSQTTAYVTIDGNNMISGLREKILSALLEIGVNGGEVFTTDTHAVNAVVLNARGYHPIGEVMDQEQLIENVKRAVAAAINNLEPAEAGWKTETVPNVKVVGQKQIESMCMLAEKAGTQAKKLALLMFPIVGILIGVLMMMLF